MFLDANGIPTNFLPPTDTAPAVPQVNTTASVLDLSRAAPSDSMAAAPQGLSDNRNIVRRKLTGYVGFANLPNQWHRKSVRKGFNFNVMVVGKWSYIPFCLVQGGQQLRARPILTTQPASR